MPLKKSQGPVSLFDIRLKGTERDVVVIRGSPEDAASVLLQGSVVLAALDNISIKRVSLKLTAVMKLRWTDQIQTVRGAASRPVKHEKVVYEHEWPNLELRSSGRTSQSSSTTDLTNLGNNVTSLTGQSHHSSSTHVNALNQGNHEFPFEVVLPGDICESVEGPEHAQIVYRFQATVERGRFANNLVKYKHLRIVRTIGADAFELSQTMSLENTWPNKVDYTIDTPSKAVAIGSLAQIHMILVPLLKGLKLGQIRVQLIETQNLITSPALYQSFSEEKMVAEHIRPAPEEDTAGMDRWEVTEFVQMPSSLSKCAQDCQIGQNIKIGHKLKFIISLLNPDGHVSELRASLPIYLFISPSIAISSLDPTRVVVPGSAPEEESLFAARGHTGSDSNYALDSVAPPNYQDHIYDKLWSEVTLSGENSAANSNESTPFRSRRSSFNDHPASELGMTALDPVNRSQLVEGLQRLELHQQQRNSQALDDYSYPASSSGHSPAQTPDVDAMSRVPSYDTAVRSPDDSDVELAPGYGYDSIGSGSLPSSPKTEPVFQRPPMRVPSSSAPGSAFNIHSLTPLSSVGGSSSRQTSSHQSGTFGNHSRNTSSSALSSLLHRSSSSRSLFTFGKKHS
ncbi:protein Rog3p [Trichomonascus vanleenenianus]|uniref:arrestin C-terminal domain-containing protein n=1 Tax=Trichomonascus vanleenenianus TaxID=2268995 RepID=UPI003ECAB7B6